MDSTTCIICAKQYKYRKGKQYCSDSCKQIAYNNRKAGLPISGVINDCIQEKRTIFYMEDYREFDKKGLEYVDIVTYFFVTKNFSENENISFVNDVVEHILNSDFLHNLKKENHPVGRQFLQFQNEFHLGKYVVKEKREIAKVE